MFRANFAKQHTKQIQTVPMMMLRLYTALVVCSIGIVTANNKRFIFRLDDIEDYYNSATQVALLDFFVDKGYGLSAGIIGQYFNGADTNLYNALKRCVNKGADKCALFNHGWDDSFEFATATSAAQAKTPIQNTDTKIKTYFPGYNLEVFVPHQNSWNQHTLTALAHLGYAVVSASSLPYSGMAWDLTKTPMQMPEQTTTGVYSSGNWLTYPISSAVSDCNAAAARGEVCVIMIHPHEFANGQYTLTMLQQLIDTLTANGFTSTNYHTVVKEVKGVVNPVPSVVPTRAPTNPPAPTAVVTTAPSNTANANNKRFIFRLDDIEDYYNSATQVALLDFFVDKGYGLSAGIIGQYFNGADTNLYNALKRCVNKGADKCALFNHGWDDSFEFATATSAAQAKTPIQNTDTKIKTYFPGYNLEVFVPHQNSWNQHTLTALAQLGYAVVSASSLPYSGMAWDLTKTPMQMPEQTTTGVYSSGNWLTYPISSAVSDCNAAAARGEVCVIMIHPHEFANGQYTLTMLQQLINTLTANGFTSTNYHTVVKEVKGVVNPVPSLVPTRAPTNPPTAAPSANPTVKPTVSPTVVPTAAPSIKATALPTVSPTTHPTTAPTQTPSAAPTTATAIPTTAPTIAPTVNPTAVPSENPTAASTVKVTSSQSTVLPPPVGDNDVVTAAPSQLPTASPSTSLPDGDGATNSDASNNSREEFKPSVGVMAGIICAGVIFLAALGVGSWYAYSHNVAVMKDKKSAEKGEVKSAATVDEEEASMMIVVSRNSSMNLSSGSDGGKDEDHKCIPDHYRRSASVRIEDMV